MIDISGKEKTLRKLRGSVSYGCLAAGAFLVTATPIETHAQETVAELDDTIVVSASRTPTAAKEVGSAVTVITAEELEQRQVRVISDVLRDVPGVAVNRSGPAGQLTQVRIRGAEGNQTLVIIDGIEMNNPASTSEYYFNNLLNTGIERIEVLRGPQSSLYGSDAIGGVINIITKEQEKGFTASARTEMGSFNTKSALASVGYGADKFALSGTIERFLTDGVSVADERNGNWEKDKYDNTTARIKAKFRPIDNLEFNAVGMLVNSDANADSSVVVVGAADGGDRSSTEQKYGMVNGKLTLLNGAWDHMLRAAYTSDDTDFKDGASTTTYISDGTRIKYDYLTNFNFETPSFADAGHTLSFGAEREEEEMYTYSGFSGPNTVSVVNYGYTGEYRVSLWDSLFLSGSLRYDDNDELFDDQVTWRGTAAYLFHESGTRLHGSYGRAVKNPTLFDLYGSTPGFTGNPNLEPEEGYGWDAGVEQALFDDKLILDVTYFNNRIKNLITGSGNTAVNVAGTSKIDGIEFTASTEPVKNLRFDATYTYTDGKDSGGVELTRRAKHIASLVGNYSFDVFERPANINLSVQYNGEQKDVVYDSFFPLATRTVTLDDYTLVNLAASYDFAEGAQFFLRGENLLNEKYQEVYGYGAPGAAVYAGFKFKFGPY
tara:strand:+ start:3858 stop:5837 length:1980 start_codon:yes stop_codon:yes gene_type:complete